MAAKPVDSVRAGALGGGRGGQLQGACRSGARSLKVLGARTEVTVTGSRDERIAAVAALQRGRIARRQLLAIGVPSSTIRWLTAHDRLFPLARGVFAVGHTAPTDLGDETVALLAAGEGAVLSHLSAAILWGLIPPQPADGQMHLTVPFRRGPTLTGVRAHRTVVLAPRDVRIRHGLPVTSPARTALDIAVSITARQLELAVDRGLVDRLFRPADLADVLKRAGGHPGRGRLAQQAVALGETSTITRSEAEERFLSLMRRADLPAPLVNRRILGYEVDFYWPKEKTVVEIDGFRFHSSRRAFEHDRQKDVDLQAAGIAPLRFTWRQLTRQPIATVVRVAQCLARSAP